HVAVEAFFDAVHVSEEAIVPQQLLQPGLVDGAQELDRAAVERLEQIAVDAVEQRDRFVVPAPPQVVGQLLQGLQSFRQMRQHRKRANRTSGHWLTSIPMPLVGEASRSSGKIFPECLLSITGKVSFANVLSAACPACGGVI